MIPQQTLFEWLFNVKCDKCLGGERNSGGEKQEFVSATCALHINQDKSAAATHSRMRGGTYIPSPPHRDSHRSCMHVENEMVKGGLIGLASVLFL